MNLTRRHTLALGGAFLRHTGLLIWALLSTLPLVYMLSASLQSNQEIYQSVYFTTLGVWNEFLFALIVFSKQSLMPLQVGLMTFQGTYFSQYALMMAATWITTVPIVLVYLVFQKFIIKGIMAGALKG